MAVTKNSIGEVGIFLKIDSLEGRIGRKNSAGEIGIGFEVYKPEDNR